MNDHIVYEDLEIYSIQKQDKRGFNGLNTNHGHIRCKGDLKRKLELNNGWTGSLTIWVNPHTKQKCVAFQQDGHDKQINLNSDSGHWNVLNPNLFDPYNHWGFIYCIENKLTNKKYIGSKTLRHRVWKQYEGSSVELLDDIQESGKENFNFNIWYSCYTKSQVGYCEAYEQYCFEVLLSDKYYNKQIEKRTRKLTPFSFGLFEEIKKARRT